MRISNIILPSQLEKLTVGQKYLYCYNYHQVDSTNNVAWELLKEKIKLPFAVTAEIQTKGKGQRGNEWRSPQGGLYLSLALEVNLSIDKINQITLFTVWGIVNQLRQLAIPVEIKWLNDLILDNYKLGGILTETRTKKNLINQVVIGIGINYQNNISQSAISLKKWQEKNKLFPISSLDNLKEIVIMGVLNGYNNFQNSNLKN